MFPIRGNLQGKGVDCQSTEIWYHTITDSLVHEPLHKDAAWLCLLNIMLKEM